VAGVSSKSSLRETYPPKKRYNGLTVQKNVAKGVGASPGQASGKLSFSAADAEARKKAGERLVFLCDEAGVEDRAGIEAAVAVVCVRGGLTGDAAIMARALGKPCVVGVPGTRIFVAEKRVVFRTADGETELRETDELTVDGKTGELLV
jgi:pyruvate,orthophosphate dikinase